MNSQTTHRFTQTKPLMNSIMNTPTHFPLRLAIAGGALSMFLLAGSPLRATESAQTFATPEAAVTALASAVQTTNRPALHALFGPDGDDLVNPDPVQGANEFADFTAGLSETNHLLVESDTRRTLVLGRDAWPFPIPIVRKEGRWSFDTAAGKGEIVNRRIGRNELDTLESVRAYVVAQREYAAKDRDGDEVLEYAQKFLSSPGRKDGLYWPPNLDGELSPLGPLTAQAQGEGYSVKARKGGAAPEPFHGYFFKILTRQAASAPGGKHDYLINGNMIAGFALVAWPAEYGESGIMTFIVNQQGKVYQKDLGPKTAKLAADLKAYDPDKTWNVSVD